MARLERQNVELIHEVRRQQEVRARLETVWRENIQGAKCEHAVQLAEIAKSVSCQQDLANTRRREMTDLTSGAQTLLGQEELKMRKLRARLHQLNVSGGGLSVLKYFNQTISSYVTIYR